MYTAVITHTHALAKNRINTKSEILTGVILHRRSNYIFLLDRSLFKKKKYSEEL